MNAEPWFEGFDAGHHEVGGGLRLYARSGGRADAPPLLLLHGYPQTHVMWQRVARRLAPHFRLVLPDLRGYGDSGFVADAADHAGHSKRAMAADLVALMRTLGHPRWFVAGQRIACDLLVLWGERGVVQRLFDPLALWRAQCAARVEGRALPAGHYIPEELPAETAQALLDFFGR